MKRSISQNAIMEARKLLHETEITMQQNSFEGAAEGRWTWSSFGIARYSLNCIRDMKRYFESALVSITRQIVFYEDHGYEIDDCELERQKAITVCVKSMECWIKAKKGM